jgi:CheY-like chemotaxis protein
MKLTHWQATILVLLMPALLLLGSLAYVVELSLELSEVRGTGLVRLSRLLVLALAALLVASSYLLARRERQAARQSERRLRERLQGETRAEDMIFGGSGPGAGRCLLVVDDEAAVREVASAMAQGLGYRVLNAENGAEGLRLFQEQSESIDVVLLDLVMPEMSGTDCFRAIRDLAPQARVIVTSGFARGDDIRQLLEEPLTWFLKKPYRRKDLTEALALAQSGQSGSE